MITTKCQSWRITFKNMFKPLSIVTDISSGSSSCLTISLTGKRIIGNSKMSSNILFAGDHMIDIVTLNTTSLNFVDRKLMVPFSTHSCYQSTWLMRKSYLPVCLKYRSALLDYPLALQEWHYGNITWHYGNITCHYGNIILEYQIVMIRGQPQINRRSTEGPKPVHSRGLAVYPAICKYLKVLSLRCY